MAAIGLVWFVVGLSLLFARAEGSPPWRSAGALVAGVLLAAEPLLDASWGAAAYRGRDDATGPLRLRRRQPRLRQCLGGDGQLRGGLWLALLTRGFGRWLGWWAVVAGLGLVFARVVWTSEFWIERVFLDLGGRRPRQTHPRAGPLGGQ